MQTNINDQLLSHFKSGIAVRCHCECHCRLIVGCFRLFACQVVYWLGCLVQLWAQVGARPGRATSATSASAAAACVHFHSSAATHPSTVCQPKSLPGRNTTAATYFHHCSPNPPVHPSQPTLASNEAYNEYLGPSPALTAPIDRRSALRARRATACDCRGVTWSRRGRPAGK